MGRRERYLVIRCLPGTQTQLPRAEPPVTVGVDLQGRARGGVGGGVRDPERTSPTQETSGGTEAGSGAGGMTRAQPSRWALWCDIFCLLWEPGLPPCPVQNSILGQTEPRTTIQAISPPLRQGAGGLGSLPSSCLQSPG